MTAFVSSFHGLNTRFRCDRAVLGSSTNNSVQRRRPSPAWTLRRLRYDGVVACASPSRGTGKQDGRGKEKDQSGGIDRVDRENLDIENESLRESTQPVYNSTLLTAMKDYFGDDGREVQDYVQRPRDSKTSEPLFRIIIAGVDYKLARKLYESNLCVGLYYLCSPKENRLKRIVVHDDNDWHEDMLDDEMFVKFKDLDDDNIDKWAQLANENSDEGGNNEDLGMNDVVEFAVWSVADAVFITKQSGLNVNETEKLLATHEITVFDHDVGSAIVDGELDVKECLSSLISEQDESSVSEALLE